MASHNAFTSPSRQIRSRDAFVIESSSPDLPPLKDLLSQTSNASKQPIKGTTRKGPDIPASKHPATTKERKRLDASTSKYWKLTSSIETPVVIDDTPPTEKYHNSRVRSPNESSKAGPSDVLGQGHRSPDQPWKAYKRSPPRIEMEGGIMSKPPKFVSYIPDSEDSVVMVDEDSKSTMEDQPLETPKSHPEKKGAKEDPSLPLNLEQAVARRLDWTPPETKKAICDNLASVFEAGTSPFRNEEEARGLKTILAGCGYEAPEETYRPIPNGENPGFLNKRKLIELVPATSANSTTPEPQEESPTKAKAPKKKPRTITELATAAYKLPTNDIVDEASATVAEETQNKSTDCAGPTANGKAKSKPRKKPAKPTKRKEPKKSVLLSPNTALKAAENQNFLFGTSSQLAREQSPTLLRDIQAAMKSSVQFDDSHILDIPVNSDLVEPQVPKPKLWEAAARNLDGDLFDVEIVDLVGNPSTPPQSEVPKDPFGYIGAENEPSLPPLSGITTDHTDETFETLSDILPPTNPKVFVPEDEPSPFSSRQIIDIDGQKPKDAPAVQSGKTSSSASKLPSTVLESNTPQHAEAAPPCPSYELFTDAQLAKEFASYGFKPVKKRIAMISLLEQCWRSKVGGAGNSARALTTSATAFHPRGNPSQTTEKPPSPKRPRGRPRKSPTPTRTVEHEQVPPPSGQPPSSPPKPRRAPRKPKSSAASLNSKQPVDPISTQESPKRGRGRPRKSPPVGLESGSAAPKPKSSATRTVIEIPDSESDNDDNSSISSSSSPELTSSPPPMPMDLSASINEDTELSLSMSNTEDEASLFEHISKAVVTAPRSTDPANPSWHEKILLYDPIVLEDLTAWLNLGQLTRVGRDAETKWLNDAGSAPYSGLSDGPRHLVPRNLIPTSPGSLNYDFAQYKAGFVDGYVDGIGPLPALPHVMSLALLSPGRLVSHFLPFNCSNAVRTLGCRAIIQASTFLSSNHLQSTHHIAPIAMSGRRQSSTASPKPISHPRPSSSVVLLSPSNQVLLLHRVQTSTSFASAHVFPGGNLDPYHDGAVPDVDSPGRHEDGEAYRLGAIRECFEETGILLAKAKNGGDDLIALPSEEIQAARKKIHNNQIKFGDWLESINAVPDTSNLRPFTRWVTPTNVPKRFTTQMYLYMLPLASNLPSEMLVPTPDGGVEHTAAVFAPAQHFLSLAASKDIILFPPQAFLLVLLTRFISAASAAADGASLEEYTSQRERLLSFLEQVPTADTPKGREHPTSRISWADKVMSPHNLFIRASDGRIVLGIDKPGPELKGTARGGDWERVVLVRFTKAGPTEVEIRLRQDVLEEERQAKGGGNKL